MNPQQDQPGPRLLSGGNPQVPKGDGPGPVQTYIDAMPGWKRDVGRRLDALVTTEKDAVKLTRLDADWPVPVAALRIDLALLADGGKILDEMIDRVLADYDMAPATESDDLGQEP